MFRISLLIILLHYTICSIGQHKTENSLFKVYTIKGIPENRFGEILISKGGQKYISASEFSFAKLIFGSYGTHTYNLTREYGIKNFNEVFTGDPIKAFAESIDRNIFFATNKNQIVYLKNSNLGMILDIPPFYFPIKGDSSREIKKLWFDNEDNLYIGAAEGSFYIAPKAGSKTSLDTGKYKIGKSNDDNMFIQKGELPVKKIIVGKGIGVYVFAESLADKNIIWLGTSNGLYEYNKITGKVNKCLPIDEKITITHIEIPGNGDIWFSTLEKGMGVYHQFTKSVEFFIPYSRVRL